MRNCVRHKEFPVVKNVGIWSLPRWAYLLGAGKGKKPVVRPSPPPPPPHAWSKLRSAWGRRAQGGRMWGKRLGRREKAALRGDPSCDRSPHLVWTSLT